MGLAGSVGKGGAEKGEVVLGSLSVWIPDEQTGATTWIRRYLEGGKPGRWVGWYLDRYLDTKVASTILLTGGINTFTVCYNVATSYCRAIVSDMSGSQSGNDHDSEHDEPVTAVDLVLYNVRRHLQLTPSGSPKKKIEIKPINHIWPWFQSR